MKPEAGQRVAAHGTRAHSEGPTVEGASSLARLEGVVGLLPHWGGGMGGLSAVADAGTKDGMAWQGVLEMEIEMDYLERNDGWLPRMCCSRGGCRLCMDGPMGGLYMHQLQVMQEKRCNERGSMACT